MCAVLKRELKNYLMNPLLWLGMIAVIVMLYQDLTPYLKLHYYQSETEFSELMSGNIMDADVMDGYIPSTKEQQWEKGYQQIKRQFVEEFDYTEDEAQEIIDELRQKDFSVKELNEYLEETYGFYNADWVIREAALYKGSIEEVNEYVREKLSEHPFSFYLSRKFADFAGLYLGFFSMVLLLFLYIRDTKKDTYELLHTKPISAREYIAGKVTGGFAALLFILGILNAIFMILCGIVGKSSGLPVRFWDIPAASVLYIVPNLFMITCMYTLISLVFKNPYPAIPMLFLYLIYSNMGSQGPDGMYGYYGRPLAIMVRFPGRFLDTTPPPLASLNQLFLVIASALMLFMAMGIWKRRRGY